MNKADRKQTSMTDWFEAIGNAKAEKSFKEEDNTKVERLTFLHDALGLPYRVPLTFLLSKTSKEQREKWAAEDPEKRVAVRLVPNIHALPKLRERGLNKKQALLSWIPSQKVDPEKYTAYIFPDEQEILWWANFAVSKSGIFGEITNGWYLDLEKGEGVNPHFFFDYDFKQWEMSPENPEALQILQKTIEFLNVPAIKREKIAELRPEFFNDYLIGYFEALVPPDGNIYFNDFNQTLGSFLSSKSVIGKVGEEDVISGVSIVPGKVQGTVRIVTLENFQSIDFQNGDILVSKTTNVDYLDLMKKAGAIVTDLGGVLSHPAIVARELKRPCIVATKIATQKLHNGDRVEVDAENGRIKKLS